MSVASKIKETLLNIHYAQSCSDRSASEVSLIAVTKTLGIEPIQAAYDVGIRDFGENRVQELVDKYPHFPADTRWHLIGHLQTNKVKYIIDKVYMIHSLDSIRLAEEIEKRAAVIDREIPCLVQINIADEDTKFGLDIAEVESFLKEMTRFPHIRIEGLMTIGPHVADEGQIRGVFQRLREISEEMSKLALPNMKMKKLSMGMSNDYMIAVEEGSTMVRVGSAIFGPRS